MQPPRNCAAATLKAIAFEGAPILYVVHDVDDHGWQFLDGSKVSTEHLAIVSMAEIVDLGPIGFWRLHISLPAGAHTDRRATIYGSSNDIAI